MFGNYLKVAIRNILRSKGFSLLVVFSLALGMAVFILAVLFTRFHMSFDRFHPEADRIQVMVQVLASGNQGELNSAVTPAPLLPALVEDFPEIQAGVRVADPGKMIISQEELAFYENGLLLVDPYFLSFFNFKMLEGDARSCLSKPDSIVLSQQSAAKYFGDRDPMGRSLVLNNSRSVRVTGVIQDCPDNTSLRYDFLAPLPLARNLDTWMDSWSVNSLTTFLKIEQGGPSERLEQKLSGFIADHFPPSPDSPKSLFLLPLQDFLRKAEGLELKSQMGYGPQFVISYFLIGMAAVLMLVVAVNYMNLSTSRYLHRAHEIGVRKVVGATRQRLITQFWGESILMTLLSFPLALALYSLLKPAFLAYVESEVSFSLWEYPGLFLLLLGGAVLVGTLSGSYPALFLSSLPPLRVIKGKSLIKGGGRPFRKILVSSQFALSILLIIFSLAIRRQVNYLIALDLGYNREGVITVAIPEEVQDKLELMKQRLIRHPDVRMVSAAHHQPINWGREGQVVPEGQSEQETWTVNTYGVDYDFIELLEIDILEGRSFSREFEETQSFILNETAVKQLGWDEPLGKTLRFGNREGFIIGVAKDFLFDNAHWAIEPAVLYWEADACEYLFIKTDRMPISGLVEHIRSEWRTLAPGLPFLHSTLNTRFESAYRYVGQMSGVFGSLGVLAVFISGLGLLATAFFSVTRRIREIGIRKVLGAPVPSLTWMLMSGFLRQVAIANLIAWPVTYILLRQFLNWAWAYRTPIPLTIFALTGFLTLLTAVLSVAYQTIKISLTNPAQALRCE